MVAPLAQEIMAVWLTTRQWQQAPCRTATAIPRRREAHSVAGAWPMAPMGRRDILAPIQGRIPVLRLVPDSVAAVLRHARAAMVAVTAAARPAVSPHHPLVAVLTVVAAVLAVAHSVAVAAAPAVDSVEVVTPVAAVAVEAAAAGSLPA